MTAVVFPHKKKRTLIFSNEGFKSVLCCRAVYNLDVSMSNDWKIFFSLRSKLFAVCR